MGKYTKFFWCLIILALFFFTNCSPKPIKIGYTGGLTGSSSELGVNGMYGALLAVEDVNSSGGINRRRLELIAKDDKNDKNVALEVDRELVKEGCTTIIGHMTSVAAELSVPYINEEKILMISPTVAMDSLGGKDDYFIRLIPSNKEQANLIADSIIKYDIKKLAVIYSESNSAFTESLKGFINQRLEGTAVKIVFSRSFKSGSVVDYDGISKDLRLSGADAAVILSSADDTAYFCQKFSMLKMNLKVFMPTWSMTNDIIKRGGPTVEGSFGVNFIDYNSSSKDYLIFRERYLKKYGSEPTFASILSYEAVMVLADTMRNSDNLSPVTLRDTLLKKSMFKGLQEEISFNRYGDIQRSIYLYRIEKGKFIKVEN